MKMQPYRSKKLQSFKYFFGKALTIIAVLLPVMGHCNDLNKQELTNNLFLAVLTNNISEVRLSITKGADINATNQEGLTPAGLAIEKGFYSIAHYIVGIRNQNLMKIKSQLSQNKLHSNNKNSKNENRSVDLKNDVNIELSRKKNRVPVWPEGKPNPFSPTIQTLSPIIIKKNQADQRQKILNPKKNKNISISRNSGPLQISNMEIPKDKNSPTPLQPIETIIEISNSKKIDFLDSIFGQGNITKSHEEKGSSEKIFNNEVDGLTLKKKKNLENESWWESITSIF